MRRVGWRRRGWCAGVSVCIAAFSAAVAQQEPAPDAAAADVTQLLRGDPRFETMARAVETAGLVEQLADAGPYTVFAPTDEAFDELPSQVRQALFRPQNRQQLANLVKHHVVSGEAHEADDLPEQLDVMQGPSVPVDMRRSGEPLLVTATGDTATLPVGNLRAANGLVHGLDAVLLTTDIAQALRGEPFRDPVEPTLPPRLADERALRDVPYEGTMMDERATQPLRPPPPESQRPLQPWVMAALMSLYERPTPPGPDPIPRPSPTAIYAIGGGPVVAAMPGPTVYADHLPEIARIALPPKTPFSNHMVRLREGEVRFAAYDHTRNDTRRSLDTMDFEASWTDTNGDEWQVVMVMIAPLSPSPVSEPWFGGVAIDTLYHGETGNGTPAFPLVRCMVCAWGWADVYRNGERVDSSAPLHVMLTSDVRAGPEQNFEFQCYDCKDNPIREIHVILAPRAGLSVPGGFWHVMWEMSDWQRGAPEEIAAMAPEDLGIRDLPRIELDAVPYLDWSDETIRLQAGQDYFLRLSNRDMADYHAFMVHTPDGKISFPLPHGSDWGTVIRFDKVGTYHFGCPVDNHRNRGMTGRFIVEE